ncbi:MAG: radical SAM protein [Anaerolineaceae bacterium]|nr:radical SAM protein [Anaerolineaceae bacterium]
MNIPFDPVFDQIPEPYATRAAAQLHALQSHSQGPPAYSVDQRGLPVPVWVRRGLPDEAGRAWEVLQTELHTAPRERPLCIYLHVPFCDSHCEFCDCYAFALRRHRERHTQSYTAHLCTEIGLWAGQVPLSRRPVTSIHFGGGTPTTLGWANLERLVGVLGAHFSVGPQTEWALETTSSSLDEEAFARLHALGFRRLHIGVQSLQDEVRQAIGRREPGAAALQKIERARGLGWIVSVDVITGLPGQTPAGLLDDLDRLVASGAEGFSIYELQHSSHNHRFFESHNLLSQPVLRRYSLFQLAFQHLEAQGYTKNVFNHLARGRDRNLYFTFPQRGEDLLAIGTISDGVFGNYHYRHPEYWDYTRQVSPHDPGLLGGLRRTPQEDRLHRIEVQLMSGHVDPHTLGEILGEDQATALLRKWLKHHMVAASPHGDGLALTTNGAWFIGQLLQEAIHCSSSTRPPGWTRLQE